MDLRLPSTNASASTPNDGNGTQNINNAQERRVTCLLCPTSILLNDNGASSGGSLMERSRKLKNLCHHMKINSTDIPPQCSKETHPLCENCEQLMSMLWKIQGALDQLGLHISKIVTKIEKSVVDDHVFNAGLQQRAYERVTTLKDKIMEGYRNKLERKQNDANDIISMAKVTVEVNQDDAVMNLSPSGSGGILEESEVIVVEEQDVLSDSLNEIQILSFHQFPSGAQQQEDEDVGDDVDAEDDDVGDDVDAEEDAVDDDNLVDIGSAAEGEGHGGTATPILDSERVQVNREVENQVEETLQEDDDDLLDNQEALDVDDDDVIDDDNLVGGTAEGQGHGGTATPILDSERVQIQQEGDNQVEDILQEYDVHRVGGTAKGQGPRIIGTTAACRSLNPTSVPIPVLDIMPKPVAHPVPATSAAKKQKNSVPLRLEGCRLPVQITDQGVNRWQTAEILQVKDLANSKKKSYYVHFLGFNSRLDGWVNEDKLDFSKAQYPDINIEEPIRIVVTDNHPTTPVSVGAQFQQFSLGGHSTTGGLSMNPVDKSVPAAQSSQSQLEVEEERVKKVELIELGKYRIKPWYYSPYPQEFAGLACIYICEFCLKYETSREKLAHHLRQACKKKGPPGKEIYRKQGISIFEVDGTNYQQYGENLFLLGQLFLEHKLANSNTKLFLFYVMTYFDERGFHMVGYFSKAKVSPEDYNVSCILTLPPYQGKGFGNLLIEFSYLLSKTEKKLGSPEKPLSDLGLLSYRSYWSHAILRVLVGKVLASEGSDGTEITISDICNKTAINKDDVISTLISLGICSFYKDGVALILTKAKQDEYEEKESSRLLRIDPKALRWAPKKWST